MSYADEVFIRNCRDILTHGVWDTDQAVRPHWEDDGAPAHTVKKFGIVNRYDLSKEFPLLTLRRTYWKTAVDELLWIWQQKSNNIHDLRGHIWDQWADETGSIGKAYGYQIGVKSHYPQGDFDQMDKVLSGPLGHVVGDGVCAGAQRAHAQVLLHYVAGAWLAGGVHSAEVGNRRRASLYRRGREP